MGSDKDVIDGGSGDDKIPEAHERTLSYVVMEYTITDFNSRIDKKSFNVRIFENVGNTDFF